MRLHLTNKRTPKGGQEGFIILESLISIAIVGIFMSGVTYMMWGGLKSNTLARKTSEATSYGIDVLERIETMNFNNPRLLNNTYAEPPIMETDANGNQFTKYQFLVTTNLGGSYPNTNDIEVFVFWLDPKSQWVHPVTNQRVTGVTLRDIIIDPAAI